MSRPARLAALAAALLLGAPDLSALPAPQGSAAQDGDSAHPAKPQGKGGKAKGKAKGPRKAKATRAAEPDSEPPYVPPPMPTPLPGSLLPGHRIVTYYGNPLSKRMGILGEIEVDQMLARLEKTAAEWQAADTTTKVLPGLELVATVASDQPGPSGLYRTRMRDTLIQRVIGWAERKKWQVILDIQVGNGDVKAEVERLLPFLDKPYVHLALDPEFDLPKGIVPGKKIGSTDASDINLAIQLIGDYVTAHKLPPKVLLVHRFTGPMVTHYKQIKLDARVQLVMVMDGFGSPSLKLGSYKRHIRREPVQYAGFKLFYKNDKPIMSPAEVLRRLVPIPYVIIYQ
ncbi:MAG: hypothetical protein HY275_01250 [Gemmatimonadetes bacterium]|nr:hypothetical protein [Gemmatimonadota bacterium]